MIPHIAVEERYEPASPTKAGGAVFDKVQRVSQIFSCLQDIPGNPVAGRKVFNRIATGMRNPYRRFNYAVTCIFAANTGKLFSLPFAIQFYLEVKDILIDFYFTNAFQIQ